jgi:hypothetical protein
MKMNIVIKDNENNTLYETDSPTKVLFYCVCRDYGENTHEKTLPLIEIGFEMYLKDYNYTPIGHLADYIATQIKDINKFKELTRYEQLDLFYKWIESSYDEDEEDEEDEGEYEYEDE